MSLPKLAPRTSQLGTIVLLFVLSATAGALAGATAAYVVTPTLIPTGPLVVSTSTTPIVPTSTASVEPSLVPVDSRLAVPLLPSNFLTRRSSPVASLYRKPRGTTTEDRTLSDDRLLGQAVALTSDGWFVTTAAVLGALPLADLTLWQGNTPHVVTLGYIDHVNGTVYLKIDARDLTTPAFGDVERLELGTEAWTERRPGSFAPNLITSLTEGLGAEIISSELTTRRITLSGNTQTGDIGSPVWDARGSLLGLVESGAGKPVSVIPASSISASFASLLSNGSIAHAILGVRATDLTTWKFDGDRGALPMHGVLLRDDRKTGKLAVVKDSAAAKAGLHAGDVILGIERDMLDGTRDLGEIVADYRPGASVTLHVLRGTSELSLPLIFGSLVTSEPLK
ncbi:MAG: S1C family serine protease [Patescibacteria group bacterium]